MASETKTMNHETGAPLYPDLPPAAPGSAQYTPVPNQQMVIIPPALGPKPSGLTCPSCRAEIVTRVEPKATTKTHLIALVLCLLGCWCCACIPYCADSCRDMNHYCPNCNSYLGNYSK